MLKGLFLRIITKLVDFNTFKIKKINYLYCMKPLSSLTIHRLSFSSILDSIATYFTLENRNFLKFIMICYPVYYIRAHFDRFIGFWGPFWMFLSATRGTRGERVGVWLQKGIWRPPGDLGGFFFWLCIFAIL